MSFEPPPQSIDIPTWKRWVFGFWASLNDQFVIKKADQSLDTSTSLIDDDDLQFILDKNATYHITFFIVWTSASATPDVKYQFVEPDGTFIMQGIANITTLNALETVGEANAAQALSITAGGKRALGGTILAHTSTAGGVWKVRWAQNTEDGTATICEKGSWMRARKIN